VVLSELGSVGFCVALVNIRQHKLLLLIAHVRQIRPPINLAHLYSMEIKPHEQSDYFGPKMEQALGGRTFGVGVRLLG